MSYRNITASTPERRSEVARSGGKARWANLSAEERSAAARANRLSGLAKHQAKRANDTRLANLARGRAIQAALRANPQVTTLRPVPPGYVAPAVALYREERERRSAKTSALIEDAKAMYARLYGAPVALGAAESRECR